MTDVAEYLRLQGTYCGKLGSPLYAVLLERAAADVVAGGPVARVLAGYPYQPVASAMALRLMGGAHRLALEGQAPALAAHYPSTGGDGDAERAWTAFHALVAARNETLRALMSRGVQTNEVQRAAALVGGFLTVARETSLPLRCLEIGTSGGLNLRWDHFRYEADEQAWGDAASPVVLRGCFGPGRLPFDVTPCVAERAGCDPAPVDPTTDEGRTTLLSYVWPDQVERLARLRAACDVARRVPATVVQANAADWLEDVLARPTPGVATVVFHSIMLQYLDPPSLDRVLAALRGAGARATGEAPFAWLGMEPGGEQAEVHLSVWPGGEKRLVATTGFHGQDVRWLLARDAAVP